MARQAQQRISTLRVPRSDGDAVASSGSPGHQIDSARLVGQVLEGRYRIDGVIAGGAMGHVYEATQLPFDRKVAVKVLYCGDDDETSQRFRKRFEREASIAAQLSHPNIVTIIDYGETEAGDMFMAMEYLEGAPLYRVLQEQGRFPARRALHVALQVTRALRRAHSMGVVHRDLKPANIVLRPDEDGGDFVKVLDFGLVKVFEPDATEVPDGITDENLTSAGSMMGTPGYMAPEQAVGERVDNRADLYSLGVILFQMLTGKLPFEGESIVELITAQVMRPVPFVRELEPDADCPDELEAIVNRCLNKSRDERFESADALLVAFKETWRLETDQSFGTEASLARPMSIAETVRAKALAGPEIVDEDSLPSVPLSGDIDFEPDEVLETAAVPAPIPRRRWGALVAAGVLVFLAGVAAVTFIVRPRLDRAKPKVEGLVDLPEEPTSQAPAPDERAQPTAATEPVDVLERAEPTEAAPPRAAPGPVKSNAKGKEGYKSNPF